MMERDAAPSLRSDHKTCLVVHGFDLERTYELKRELNAILTSAFGNSLLFHV